MKLCLFSNLLLHFERKLQEPISGTGLPELQQNWLFKVGVDVPPKADNVPGSMEWSWFVYLEYSQFRGFLV